MNPNNEAMINQALDKILKASGSALKHYSMPGTISAMQNAVKEVLEATSKPISAHLSHNHNGDTLIVLSTGQVLLLKDLPGYSEALEVDKKDALRYRHLRANPAMVLHLSNKDFDAAIDYRIAGKGRL